ncbi:hypothetical protein K5E_21570 [Enterococcus thailandicus]|uniref:hypothetical protein n=1 Tax=Enterococcus thailandicus TaxID=417368 RepID=UPI00244D7D5D|nr:hypothetical protein [Enterococcus thailandicus]GMC02491.1 hypothetical protein K4E_00010 [Enterococcus thailandicus]GMC10018.1 hypothetical protein K5E_21570 [Enterococcus thailandicus]
MKKIVLGIVCFVGITLMLIQNMNVYADDILHGNTAIGSEVTHGDVSLSVDAQIDFGKKKLDKVVDFGSRNITVTVSDYTGDMAGYEVTARLLDTDYKRTLKIGNTELSDTEVSVIKKDTNVVGENIDTEVVSLSYTGLTNAQIVVSNIEWNLSKVHTYQINE